MRKAHDSPTIQPLVKKAESRSIPHDRLERLSILRYKKKDVTGHEISEYDMRDQIAEAIMAFTHIDGISVEPDTTLPWIEKHVDSQSAALGGVNWVID
jgi:hypothetical protein